MLSIKNIRKKFNDIEILKNITVDFKSGEIISIVGQNGAGKTTLLKIISGLLLADEGSIMINEKEFKKKSLSEISMMLEGNKNFYRELTLYENIEYLFRLRGLKFNEIAKESLNKYLEIFSLEIHAKKPIFQLSRGMQQKVAVILNFVLPTKIILLDEPTLGLDIFSVDEFEKLIQIAQKENKVVLITSHQLNFLQRFTTRLLILDKGEIIYDGSSSHFINQYVPIEYIVSYNNEIPLQDINNLNKTNLPFIVNSNKPDMIIPGSIEKYLKLMTIDKINTITRTNPSLENAYKNFVNKEVN